MKNETTTITPQFAEHLLKQNTHNRPLDDATVQAYKRDMLSGRWQVNGETIKIATDGRIIDGQHRLTACAQSGVPLVDIILVTDLPMDVQKTIDTGRKRNMRQDLAIDGVPNYSAVAAIALRGFLWDAGDIKFAGSTRVTRMELDEYFADNRSQLIRSGQIGTQVRQAFRVANPTAVGTAHLITSRVSIGDAAEFFAQLGSGVGLKPGDAILSLRNRITNDAVAGIKNPDMVRIGLILRAWNAFRDNEPLAKMQFTKDSIMPMPK